MCVEEKVTFMNKNFKTVNGTRKKSERDRLNLSLSRISMRQYRSEKTGQETQQTHPFCHFQT